MKKKQAVPVAIAREGYDHTAQVLFPTKNASELSSENWRDMPFFKQIE